MLSNITMGQYYPTDSIVHRLDPRVKILLTIAFIVGIFLVHSLWGYALALVFVYFMARLSHVPFKMLMRGLRPLRFILVLTFVLNLFFSGDGTILWQWSFITITHEGLSRAVHYCLRLLFLVIGTSLLTLTTSPVSLSDGLELLLSPLKVIRFPAHELAMMMTIALRFIPTLLEEADKIMKAQMARGADFESGNLLARAKAMVPLLVPLFVSAFRRADELAMAMEARCYRGGKGRTRMKQLKTSSVDLWGALVSCVLAACIVADHLLF